ncbi:MAG: hypothetical protein VYD17_03430, partial [Pseudomonadota bacterium]|nr:hypothetical protein [Pseudomonadota bacterium]
RNAVRVPQAANELTVRWIFTEAVGYSWLSGAPKKQSCQNYNKFRLDGLTIAHIFGEDVGKNPCGLV